MSSSINNGSPIASGSEPHLNGREQGKPFRFADYQLESEFLRAHRAGSVGYVRVVSIVGIVMMLAFLWQDTQLSPERGYIASNLRLYAGTPLCIVLWIICGRPEIRKFIEPITAFFFVVYAGIVIGITLVFEPGMHGLSSTVAAGTFLLIVMSALTFSHLRFYWGLATGGTILLMYLASVWNWTNANMDEFLLGNFSVVAMALAVGGVSSAMLERSSRRQFFALDALAAEKERYKVLLHTLVPSAIADRIDNGEFPIADSQAEVAILFADLVGFTSLTTIVAPRTLVQFLNELFSEFDNAAERRAVEKIKTIGDGYMAACGPPVLEEKRTIAVVELGREMIFLTQRISEKYGLSVGIRVGVHTGSLIAGVIGRRRYAYDMWGESVNTASRMESGGVINRIQVSESAFRRLNGQIACEDRGEIELKGIGVMRSFLVT